MEPLVSFHVNSYNRLPLLRNLMRSFELCNEYRNIEWIFVDFGSIDGSRNFIVNYAKRASFPVRMIFSSEDDHFNKIRKRGLLVNNHWKKLRAILGLYRNKAKELSKGEFIFDLADDQQFIRKGHWMKEIFEVFEHRKLKVNKNDIASLVPFAYYRWRLDKPNNKRFPVEKASSTSYYVAKYKPYVDYSVMRKEIFNKVGKFITPLDFLGDSERKKMWQEENEAIDPWTDYENRCNNFGLVRVFLKYPIFMLFPNVLPSYLNFSIDDVICKIWTLEEMKNKFSGLDRPVSSEELDNNYLYPEFSYDKKSSFLNKLYEGILRVKSWI
ncbi:MAG: hypothetical protein A2390_02615 [Candidatus Liptonbacteria bacterium RIFOXYB1_FULL_36_10]|uniref:Glycosyltransferase 2-like domain-containing protein n=3 Tax=Candidatus Liptoniibacteriota TaxID=1817909 RepID=A0A1G2CR16_9BACT|nr:MAG: hypothetical protein A2390_02615 [Candidatus Liptonbacteria bacterium RIFOXYB1_FULL_36_10]